MLEKDFIGQESNLKNIDIFCKSAIERDEMLDHVLISGPPGYGKTTLAHIIANKLDKEIIVLNASSINSKDDLISVIATIENKVLFIDEIHQLSRAISEEFYSILQDLYINILVGDGINKVSYRFNVKPFTLIGATTLPGSLNKPFLDRISIKIEMEEYSKKELIELICNTFLKYGYSVNEDAALILIDVSCNTPRIILQYIKRIRDYLNYDKENVLTKDLLIKYFNLLGINEYGLSKNDIKYLDAVFNIFNNQGVGINTIISYLGIEKNVIEDDIERRLINQGYLVKTKQGRVITKEGMELLKKI